LRTPWKWIFASFAVISVILAAMELSLFLIMPDVVVSVKLKANIWMAFLFGISARDWILGFLTFYSYVQWKKEEKLIERSTLA
jgi:hypothetical protein